MHNRGGGGWEGGDETNKQTKKKEVPQSQTKMFIPPIFISYLEDNSFSHLNKFDSTMFAQAEQPMFPKAFRYNKLYTIKQQSLVLNHQTVWIIYINIIQLQCQISVIPFS